jgi:hypothetical protein
LEFEFPSLTLTYDNGEEKKEDNFAIIRPGANFTGVTNGEDFYNTFCNPDKAKAASLSTDAPSSTSTAAPSSTDAPSAPEPTIAGYPFPVIRDSGANVTAGYFLNDTGYDDVAVLSVSAFAPSDDANFLEYLRDFQDTVAKFLAESKQANKKRLVIDVTRNGGGLVLAGFELFTQVCASPSIDLQGRRRFRANSRLLCSLLSVAVPGCGQVPGK